MDTKKQRRTAEDQIKYLQEQIKKVKEREREQIKKNKARFSNELIKALSTNIDFKNDFIELVKKHNLEKLKF